jgi:hypothetical protein
MTCVIYKLNGFDLRIKLKLIHLSPTIEFYIFLQYILNLGIQQNSIHEFWTTYEFSMNFGSLKGFEITWNLEKGF